MLAPKRPLPSLPEVIALLGRIRSEADDDLVLELDSATEALRIMLEKLRSEQTGFGTGLGHAGAGKERDWFYEAMYLPVLVVDPAGLVVTANRESSVLLGMSVERLPGVPIQTFVTPERRREFSDALQAASDGPVRFELELATRYGTTLGAQLLATPETGPERRVALFVLGPTDDAEAAPRVNREHLVAALAEVCSLGAGGESPRALLTAAARVAQPALLAVGVSITIGAPDEPTAVMPSNDAASAADGWQVQAAQGPCVDAWHSHEPVLSQDIGHDPRWPRLGRLARSSGPLPTMSLPIVDGHGPIGVVNCYLDEIPTPDLVRQAMPLSRAIAGLIRSLNAQEELRVVADQLKEALTSRAVIDQAKGIVMADRHCDAEEAFQHLARLSQDRNVKLRDLATQIVIATGATPATGGHATGATGSRHQ